MKKTIPPQIMKVTFTDQQIIDGLKDEDEAKQRYFQDLFYRRYVNYIYKVAIQKCRNFPEPEELAKDVTQETFIRVFKAIIKFNFKKNVASSEHSYILKAWLGKIGNNCFRKIYASRVNETLVEINSPDFNEVLCPACGEFLIEDKVTFFCKNNHYKIPKQTHRHAQPLPEAVNSFDLFESLYASTDEVEVPNEFRIVLQEALNLLKDDHKHILLTYANEGCISTPRHLSDSTMEYLCKMYDTSPENIRQIKKRALDKVKEFCFTKIQI